MNRVIDQSFRCGPTLYNASPPAAPNNSSDVDCFHQCGRFGQFALAQLAVPDPTQTDPMVPAKLGYDDCTTRRPTPAVPSGGSPRSFRAFTSSLQRGRTAAGSNISFTLDGRWLHAFNGPGDRHADTRRRPAYLSTYYGELPYTGPMTSSGGHFANAGYQRPAPPRRRGHGRGLRRLRPGELVPGDPERRRPGDDPLVPPAGDRPRQDVANNRSTIGLGSNFRSTNGSTQLGRFGVADPPARSRPTATTRPPSPTWSPTRPPARSPMTSTTTATGSPTRSGSTWATRPGATAAATSTSRCSPSWSSA